MSAVHSSDSKWHKTLTLNKCTLTFKVDTGADVTVIPSTDYSIQYDGPLQPSTRQLTGAGQHSLQVDGQFRGCLLYQRRRDLPIYFCGSRPHQAATGLSSYRCLAYCFDD